MMAHISLSDEERPLRTTTMLDDNLMTLSADQALALALQHHSAGRLAEAELLCQQVLTAAPYCSSALQFLGVIAHQTGRADVAEAYLRRVIEQDESDVAAHTNLGHVLQAQGNLDEAVRCYERALRMAPDFVDAQYNLAVVRKAQGQLDEAAEWYRKVLALSPGHLSAKNNLANLLRELGFIQEAVAMLKELLARERACAETHNNLGIALAAAGDPDGAASCFAEAIRLKPDYAHAHQNLGQVFMTIGLYEAARICFMRALDINPSLDHARALLQIARGHLCDWSVGSVAKSASSSEVPHWPTSLADDLESVRGWVRRRFEPFENRRSRLDFTFDRSHRERLRVGYISGDYRDHALAYLASELFERHDRRSFEILGYSYGPDDDSAQRRRIAKAFDRFIDVRTCSAESAASQIHDDGVDILVDLTGHALGARTEILALRPAPIQVNYLGYPGTMGAPFMDYILTDPFLTPEDKQPFFDERFVYLPDSYQVNDSTRPIAKEISIRASCGLPENGFVFCCFNGPAKITEEVFESWLRLLARVPSSVLWMRDCAAAAKSNLAQRASARGIAPTRLIYARLLPNPEHLARHRLADLFLDTFPCNAHTTASDALWSGLPIVTRVGETFASRVAGSLLRAVGLPELVTQSPSEYEALALHLAQSPAELAEIRCRLWKQRETAPLFDCKRFTLHLESAYRQMWTLYAAGQSPSCIRVSSSEPP